MKYEPKEANVLKIVNSFRRNCVFHLIIQLQFSHFSREPSVFIWGSQNIPNKKKRKNNLAHQDKNLLFPLNPNTKTKMLQK